MGLTDDEKRQALQYATNGADFMFSGSPELRQMIVNDHPKTSGIEANLKTFILEGKAVAVETVMIVNYCRNKLDADNTWLLDHGDIRVIPHKIKLK